MTRPLRQRHRRIVIVLGIFLPVAFAIGIAARRPIPLANELSPSLAIATQPFGKIAWQRTDLFAKAEIQVRLSREHSGAGKFAVSFSAAKDFVKPDLLVYWSARNTSGTNTLPENAILLGAFASPQLSLPESAEKSDGTLILFSLADNEIVDVSKPIHFDGLSK
jgi:hypothetical protein